MVIKKLLYFVFIIFFALQLKNLAFANPYGKNDDYCKSKILNYYKKMRSSDVNSIYFDYNIKCSFQDSIDYKPIDQRVKINMRKDLFVYKSEMVEMYKDSTDFFMLMKNENTIFWSSAEAFNTGKDANKYLMNLEDTFLLKSKTVICNNVNNTKDSSIINEITFYYDIKDCKEYEYVKFCYNENKQQVSSVEIKFRKGYKINKQTVSYNELVFNDTKEIPNEFRSTFLTPSGNLKKNYSQYQLIKDDD